MEYLVISAKTVEFLLFYLEISFDMVYNLQG